MCEQCIYTFTQVLHNVLSSLNGPFMLNHVTPNVVILYTNVSENSSTFKSKSTLLKRFLNELEKTVSLK